MAAEQRISPQQLANGLGWFSIGLGLAELAAPTKVAQLIGVADETKTTNILRFYGARELAAGIGILSGWSVSTWLWARVAGDILDLSSLGKAMASDENDHRRVLAATASVIGATAADVRCTKDLSRSAPDRAA